MNNFYPEFLKYYDKEMVLMISDKYKLDYMKSLIKYLNSKTYEMVSNPKMTMWQIGVPAIFDIYENELNGNIYDSVYLRSDVDK